MHPSWTSSSQGQDPGDDEETRRQIHLSKNRQGDSDSGVVGKSQVATNGLGAARRKLASENSTFGLSIMFPWRSMTTNV
ncbi:hypothetical protein [Absidia glauca]|uniref:Uncharacterized protein n=1 Tax=Absidia glauca TaxID=4829 RepID=A0A163LYX7_ABSGL|nr:hypothetical protein [Absidia glauca]